MSYFKRALRRPLFLRLALVFMVLFTLVGQTTTRWAGSAFAGAPIPAALPQETGGTQGTPNTLNAPDASSQCTTTAVPAPKSFIARPGQAQRMTNDEATLDLGGDAVTAAIVLTITPLLQTDLAVLDDGMTNVTKGARCGYKFGPHGMHFNKNITVTLPYNKSLIPPGMTEQDVKTFYFDDQSGTWKELERIAVDTQAKTISSRSDHFTNMINGTVAVPDHPQPLSDNPNSMKDIKAADPGTGIHLIEPPQPNNTGDARLSYPIEVPPGRAGMQPQLVASYNSGGGNGWLGMGWDLPMQSVSIDTRWGVPRYRADKETETYMLTGQELTPVFNRTALEDRSAERVFHMRTEGSFSKIIRHGDNPTNYSWEVTDKNGTKYFYGDDPAGNPPGADYTLKDASGDVFKWALRESRDLDGNGIKYTTVRVSDVGVDGGTVQGYQLYLKTVSYTSFNGVDGPYKVIFTRDRELSESRRPDVTIDARGGFKMVTADLLRRVEVQLNNQSIRSYDFNYQEGAFKKTLLHSIVQRGENGELFNTHEFSYFDEVRDGGGTYQGFGAPGPSWTTGQDNLNWATNTAAEGLLGPLAQHISDGRSSALSGALSDSIGGHLYLGFNPADPLKEGSVGFKIGFNHSSNDGLLALIDINGDNLPDKVFNRDNTIYYRLNRSGPNGTPTFDDQEPPPVVANLNKISEETSNTFSLGVEEYFAINGLINDANTFTTGSAYFSDVNGDGLPDLVDDGQVWFDHLALDGTPTFTHNSGDTPVPLGPGAAIDGNGIVEDYQAVYEQEVDNFPLLDSVRRWVAPYNGNIQITGNVALIQDTSAARAAYQTADGVRVAIQKNNSELWFERILQTDYAPKTPTGVSSITVSRGDRLYFRVQSVFDGKYDQVQWNPQIEYTGVSASDDVNGLNIYHFKASEDFAMAGRQGINVDMPITGTVRLAGDLHKLGVTSDDINLRVYKNNALVSSQSLGWNQTGDIPLSQDILVVRGDSIKLRVKVDSPIDLAQLSWNPRLFYISSPDPNQVLTDSDGNYIFQLNPPYDIDTYPVDNLTGPQSTFLVPPHFFDSSVPFGLEVEPHFTVSSNVTGTLVATVKTQTGLVAKHAINIVNGAVQNDSNFVIVPDVAAGTRLYLDLSAYDPNFGANITNTNVHVTYFEPVSPFTFHDVTVPSAYHRAATTDDTLGGHNLTGKGLFSQPYRGWGYTGYNGNRIRATQPIDESQLTVNASVVKADFDPHNAGDRQAAEDYMKNTNAWWFSPLPCGQLSGSPSPDKPCSNSPLASGFWGGVDETGWVMADKMSSSRKGVDFFDVPSIGSVAGASAVSRLSHASQVALGIGAFIFGASHSDGSSYGSVDYLDMNGDKFPDIVANGRVQYTLMSGGLDDANHPITTSPDLGKLRNSDDTAENLSISGSPASFSADSDGNVDTNGDAPRDNHTSSQMVSVGLSASLGDGSSDVEYDLVDVNADTLPDRVSTDGTHLTVAFNLGYGFAPPEPWGNSPINAGSSESFSIGPSLGFNSGDFSFAGGLTLNANGSSSDQTLLDINGDGLLDRVRPNGNSVLVAFNKGNGFAPEVPWNGALDDEVARNVSAGLGAGIYFTIGIGPLCLAACYIIVNPGADFGRNLASQRVAIRDIDGDGYPDFVTSDSDDSMAVAPNNTGRTNLLRSVSRPLGGRIDLEYQRDGNTYDLPQSRWVLSKVSTDDGHPGDGVDTMVKTFHYDNGIYNRLERQFYGYGNVTEEDRDASNGNALFRSIEREYANDSYYRQALLLSEVSKDSAGHKFVESQNTYVLRDVTTGIDPADPLSTVATEFPMLARTDQRFYEGQPAPGKATYMTYAYDTLGNITQFLDAGDVGAQDDTLANIVYFSCPATYLVGKAKRIVVTGNGTEMRRRDSSMDCSSGNVTEVRQFLGNGDAAISDMDYFGNGNLMRFTGPANRTGQRYQLNYQYDPVAQTHITGITDSFGYSSSSTYNLKFGQAATNDDLNNNRTSYTYDVFGRVTTITGPEEQASANPTFRFEYHPDDSTPWALTKHIDTFRDPTGADTLNTVLFIDGMKRMLQTKKDETIFTDRSDPAQDVMVVSGRVTFDFVGRVVEQFYPITETLGTPGVFNATYDAVQPTRMTFDVLDRITRTTIPDNTFNTNAYGFGTDRSGATQFQTTATDANGIQKKTYRDVRQQITALQEFHAPPGGISQSVWTSYAYDPLQQLVEVKDDHNNLTSMLYDNLGRRTSVNNPDTGRTDTTYDLASDVTAKITANLRAENRQINYDYDFNRLRTITYPDFPANNVSYVYGAPGASDNRAGRITRVNDQSGKEDRFYGKLGETTKEVRSVRTDTGPTMDVYTTTYTYDTWNRMQNMTYPDGEVLTYRYDSGGQPRAVSGVKGQFTYHYVDRMEYDKFEQRAFVKDGNGIETQYNYREDNRRLANLQAGQGVGNNFQNLNYTYDPVGNVLNLANNVPVPPPSQFGGPTNQHFQYDDLYRLTSAAGTYQFMPNKTRVYSMNMQYDTIDNILSKVQTDDVIEPSGQPVRQHKTTYDFTYAYAGTQPHAPTHIDDRTYTYDADGNQRGWTNDRNGTRRNIVWDEENRIQSTFDNGHQETYKYDDAGTRVIKRGPQGETVYVNSYFTIRNKEIGTKNVYIGTTRLVSKMMKQDKPNGNPNGQQPEERQRYFYHPDEIGSSNYVTDANGQLYEHIEYFPFGETWVEESSNTQRTPYQFTSKELDEETDLYYYGARYFDPRTSVWQSADPMIWSKPEDSIGKPSLLSAYTYGKNNPLVYVDPDGLDPTTKIDDPKNPSHYEVRGTTLKSANTQLSAVQRKQGWVGLTSYSFPKMSNLKVDKQGRITDVTVKIKITMKLPNWNAPKSVGPLTKAEWDRFSGALSAHEQGHADIVHDSFDNVADQLVGKTKAEAQKKLKEVWKQMNAKQKDYDRIAGHGVTQSAFSAGAQNTVMDLGIEQKELAQQKSKPPSKSRP